MISKHKYFLFAPLLMGVAIIVVITLMIISGNTTFRKSDFNRKFINKEPLVLYHSKKVNGLRAICGIQNNHIYFETDTAGRIIEIDSTLSNMRLFKFGIPDRRIVQSLYSTFIDSSYCYIMAGNVPEIIRFKLADSFYQVFYSPKNLFSQSVVTSNNNYVFRIYKKSEGKWDQVFTRWNTGTNTFFSEKTISEKRGDAGFSTDGMLLFDESTSRILYVEYFSNQFICIDTLLNILYKSQTIDTFSNPTINVLSETNRYSKIITNGSPLHLINLESKAENNRLYIHSSIQADNERNKDFKDHAVIDIYQISDGHYFGSFYIPDYKEERLKDFEVAGHKIIVLYKNYIIIYSTPFNL